MVAFYSEGQYVSKDLDFVNMYFATRKKIRAAMEEIEFLEDGRHFVHPETKLFIEFPPGPLSVGNQIVSDCIMVSSQSGSVRILTPADCVKDRLAAFYYWNDHQCLIQAQMVCKNQNVDIGEIEDWSKKEGKTALFLEIKSRLK